MNLSPSQLPGTFVELAALMVVLMTVLTIMGLTVKLLLRLGRGGKHRYESRRFLLTKGERAFYGVLLASVPPDVAVFAKVRLADLMTPRSGKGWQTAFNRIAAKHVDFALCGVHELEVRACVELDDKSHQSRGDRDRLVNECFASAGIPLLRIPAQRAYGQREIREMVAKVTAPRT